MIWLKRLLPIVLIGLAILGYRFWDQQRETRATERTENMARTTAEVWVAAAEFHDEPEAFLSWRDSVLALKGLSKEEMQKYLDRYEKKSEEYLRFTRLVSYYVDSIVAVSEGREPPSRDSTMSAQP